MECNIPRIQLPCAMNFKSNSSANSYRFIQPSDLSQMAKIDQTQFQTKLHSILIFGISCSIVQSAKAYLGPSKHLWLNFFAKNSKRFLVFNYFRKMFHHRCLTESWTWLLNIWIYDVIESNFTGAHSYHNKRKKSQQKKELAAK